MTQLTQPGLTPPGLTPPGVTLPGFADPTRDSQACFRAVLGAMASPGAVAAVAAPSCPAGLLPSSAAVLLCLADADTPVWLDTAHAAARGWIAFHCGAAFGSMETAAFVVADTLPALDELDAGTEEAPEASATLILHVAALGHGKSWLLDGPGLAAPTALAVTGLPEDFAAFWAANRARFPRGVDLILCAGDRLAAIPRSIYVTVL